MNTIATSLRAYTDKVEQCLSIYKDQGTSIQLTTEIAQAKSLGQQFLIGYSRQQKRNTALSSNDNINVLSISSEEQTNAIKACMDVCALPRIARDIGPVAGVIYATLLSYQQDSDTPLALLWQYTLLDDDSASSSSSTLPYTIDDNKKDTCLGVSEFITAHALYLPLCRGLLVVNSSELLKSSLPRLPIVKLDCLGVIVEPTTLMELIFYLAVGMSNQPLIQHRFMAFDTLTLWFDKLDAPLDASKRQWLISLIWDSWRDPADAVQHKVKVALEGLLKNLAAFPMDDLMTQQVQQFKDQLVTHLLTVDWREEMKYGFLCCLVPYVSMDYFIDDKLQSSIMMALSDVVLASYAMALLVTIMEHLTIHDPSSHYWSTVWIPFLSRGLLSSDATISNYTGRVVSKLFKFNSSTFRPLYNHVVGDKHIDATSNQGQRIFAWLTVLKTAKANGLITVNTELQDLQQVGQLALIHPEEQVRLDMLALVCETRRTTDPITVEELSIVQQFLRINMNVTRAHFRQNMYAAITRLMKRLHDNAAAYTHGRPERSADVYYPGHQFVAWLIRHCLRGLYPNAPFTRVAMSLKLLYQLLDHFLLPSLSNTDTDTDTDSHYHCRNCKVIGRIVEEHLFTSEATQSLVTLLLDNYDANRLIALKCLAYFPAPLPGYESLDKVEQQLIAGAWSSLADPKASQSDGGAAIILLVFQKYIVNLGWYLSPSNMQVEQDNELQDARVHFMTLMLKDIEARMNQAKSNLSMATRRHPVHGILKAFSYIYRDTIDKHLQASSSSNSISNEQWSTINQQLLSIIEQTIEIVVTALEHPAPEGYEQDDDELLVLRSQDHHYLLTYCWRGIKEASALLEDIVRGGVQSLNQNIKTSFISVDLIIDCGNRLKQLLMGLRHRGAFSHISSHFEAVCQLLHQSHDPRLSAIVREWLKSILEQMQSTSISITRRSGGIPYGIMALVLCDASGQMLHTAVSQLFDMTSDIMSSSSSSSDVAVDSHSYKNDEEKISGQVHAMNTLRMLLTDARLSKNISRYIEHSFKLAIHGMASSSWPIRNCSVMMLSSLINRVFGIKSLMSDEKDTFNGLSVREFFKKYPQLEPFLLSRLVDSKFNHATNPEQVETSLYPVLLVLAHLKPSLSDQDIPNQQQTDGLAPLIKAIRNCASSRVYKIREMASYALVALVNPNQILMISQELVADLHSMNDQLTTNELHGRLCQLYQLLRQYPRHQPVVSADVTNQLMALFESLSIISQHPCQVLSLITIKLIKETLFTSRWWQSLNWTEEQVHKAWIPWLKISWQACQLPLIPTQPGATQCRPFYYALLTQNALVQPQAVWLPDNIDSGLDLLKHHLLPESHYLVYPAILKEIQPLSTSLPSAFGSYLLNNIIQQNDMDPDSLNETMTILRSMNSIQEEEALTAYPILWQRFQGEKRLGRRCSTLPLLSLLISRMKSPSHDRMLPWTNTLKEATMDEAPLEMRKAVVTALSIMIPSGHFNIQLGWILWQLMQDDDEDIRRDAITVAATMNGHSVETLTMILVDQFGSTDAAAVITPLFNQLLIKQDINMLISSVHSLSLDNHEVNDEDGPLFEQEPLNTFREALYNTQLASNALLRWYRQYKSISNSTTTVDSSSVFHQLVDQLKQQTTRLLSRMDLLTSIDSNNTAMLVNQYHQSSVFIMIYQMLMGTYVLAKMDLLNSNNDDDDQSLLTSFISTITTITWPSTLSTVVCAISNAVSSSNSEESFVNDDNELYFMLG